MLYQVFANRRGEIISSKYSPTGKSWRVTVPLKESEVIPLPPASYLWYLPNHLASFLDKDKILRETPNEFAVAAILPPNYLRLLLPGYLTFKNTSIPLYGYTAVGWKNNKFFAAAKKIDSSPLWLYSRYEDRDKLKKCQEKKIKQFPKNRILKHLINCSLNLKCWTAANIFLEKGEGGIPTTYLCNADCVGCISLQEKKNFSLGRIGFVPEIAEIVEIAVSHLKKSKDNIVSFGQGCEGEPTLNFDTLEKSICEIRKKTDLGTIHINTNGSIPEAIKKLGNSGLNSIRVSLNSADASNYQKYFRGKYSFTEVKKTLLTAKESGISVFLNLLTFPGFTDREDEMEKLFKLISEVSPDMLQLRNLNIDPEVYIKLYGEKNKKSIGMLNFLEEIKKHFPKCKIGSFNRHYWERNQRGR